MLKIGLVLLCIYAGLLFFLYLNQRQLIYFPFGSAPDPANVGLPDIQVVTLKTHDGLSLKAWYQPPLNSSQPTLIYFHGNAGNLGHRSRIIQPFLKQGYGVLLVAYRGYSGNPGSPNEQGFYQDGRAAIEFLYNEYTSNSCIVLYGESIGTAVAIQMAAEYPVGALILQSPFPSLGEVGQFHYPYFPVKWLIKDQFLSIKKTKQIHSPVLVLYGNKDEIIPPDFSVKVFKEFSEPKEIREIPDIGHNDLFNASFAIGFIKKHVKCLAKGKK